MSTHRVRVHDKRNKKVTHMFTNTKSYHHRATNESLLGSTIAEHFASIVQRFPDNEALVALPQGRRLSYAELSYHVDQLAKGLLGIGFRKGDRIGIWSTNNIEWFVLQLATARIGAILVNINPAYRPRELAYALRQSQVQGLFLIPSFHSSDYIAILVEAVPELKDAFPSELSCESFPALKRVVVYEPTNVAHTLRPYSGFTTWSEVLEYGAEISTERLNAAGADLDCDDPINIQYTSGTTGFPKAVMLSHHNILNNAYFTARTMHFGAADRLCISVPFYHCFGMVLSNLLCVTVGACAVIPCEHFDALKILEAIEQEHCTALHGVPTMFIAELEHPQFHNFNLNSLRTGIMAGAPCPAALLQRVIDTMKCREILVGYGQTEASPLTHLTAPEDSLERRINTVGANLHHQEVKIVDPSTNRTVPLGEVGEICFRGYHVMKGYYADADATRNAIDAGGWLHSGDLGTMDPDGYVKITGRLKDMIIRGGENIYPREIEDVLFTHPKIAEVAVIGVPDAYYGEEIMAWIKPHKGESLGEEEVRNFCKTNLAHFKVPKYVWFVEEFPMTVTGKLQKFRMREIAVEKLQNA